jgi:hypothetical protein
MGAKIMDQIDKIKAILGNFFPVCVFLEQEFSKRAILMAKKITEHEKNKIVKVINPKKLEKTGVVLVGIDEIELRRAKKFEMGLIKKRLLSIVPFSGYGATKGISFELLMLVAFYNGLQLGLSLDQIYSNIASSYNVYYSSSGKRFEEIWERKKGCLRLLKTNYLDIFKNFFVGNLLMSENLEKSFYPNSQERAIVFWNDFVDIFDYIKKGKVITKT